LSLNLKIEAGDLSSWEWSDRDDVCVTFDSAKPEVLIESRASRQLQVETLSDHAIKLRVSSDNNMRRIRVHRFSNQAVSFSTRLIVELASGAEVEIDEEVRQTSDVGHRAVHETGIILGENSKLRWVQSGFFSSASETMQKHRAQMEAGSEFTLGYFAMGGKRNEFASRVDLLGRGARAKVRALQLGQGREKHKQTWEAIHGVPGASSEFQIGALAEDVSFCEMNGLLRVDQGAENSSAIMKMKGLFRSARAQIEGRPQLEILNDNVQVAHGCAMSPIDPEQLFYLRSRGLSATEAEDLIAQGFVADYLQDRDDEQKQRLLKTIFGELL